MLDIKCLDKELESAGSGTPILLQNSKGYSATLCRVFC